MEHGLDDQRLDRIEKALVSIADSLAKLANPLLSVEASELAKPGKVTIVDPGNPVRIKRKWVG